MSELHFIVHPTSQDLNEKIREVADKLNKYGSHSFPALNAIRVQVKQVVVGPNHFGILLEDGRALRVAYSVIPERLDLSKPEKTSSNGANSNVSKSSPTPRQLHRTRSRIMRATTSLTSRGSGTQGTSSRQSGVIIGSGSSTSRSLVTVPTFVPEELVSQAQGVLQGKSRNLIIRELQRTNLDVNLAVNNLLSRDDEEGEDTEEGSDNYVPEDLISLLDGGFHSDNSVIIDADTMFSEDIFGYSSIRNRARNSERNSNSASNTNNDGATGGSGSGSSGTSGGSSSRTTTSGVNCSSGGTSSAVSSGAAATSSSFVGGDLGRWRDRQYFGPRKWFHTLRDESSWDKDEAKKKDLNHGVPLWISDELEYWPEREAPLRFAHIAALHSEFIGVTVKGELHQWRWADSDPYKNAENPNIHHPKALQLSLLSEKILHISASSIRCSVATESGKIATWMDESLGTAGIKLEHVAISYPEFSLDKIVSLSTCTLYTVARTESNELFWWGVLPFGQRKRLWEKYKAKSKKPSRANSHNANSGGSQSSQQEITIGTQVCMKNCPMYQPGAIGFTVINGVPKVGQLLNAAWDLSTNCRFKIITMPSPNNNSNAGDLRSGITHLSDVKDIGKVNAANNKTASTGSNSGTTTKDTSKETADRLDMPPPPSPASSTCSDTGSASNKRQKRLAPKEELEVKKDEETWQLKDVIFVEDVRSVPVGRVLKVDGAYAAVRFPTAKEKNEKLAGTTATDESDVLADCRLMKKDDLQVLKSTTTSRIPDCFQKTPRRIVLNSQLSNDNINSSQLITFDIDTKGIHAILKAGSKLHYSVFNLNGRQEQDSVFPTDTTAFLGTSQNNISLICTGDSISSVTLLRDGNNTIYPIAKDCLDAIKDPQWADMPPIKCVDAIPLCVPSLSGSSSSSSNGGTSGISKSFVAMIVMATETQLLMSRILRCDLEGVKHILAQLEGDLKLQAAGILSERIDGNRNIFHACISICAPSSNKDTENEITTTNSDNLNVITGISTSNRPVSIREVVRRAIHRNIDSSAAENPPPPPPSEEANSMPVVYWPPEYDPGSEDDDSMPGLNSLKSETYVSEPTERRANAHLILSLLCEDATLQPYLKQFLSTKDAHGQTPFMLSVSVRAYQAAITLLNTIMKISNGDTAVRDSMVFPPGSSADHSPLYVLCCNDTCSFTWTGADHINQDIFECRTCGLTGSLCCCTECARVCHKGHDCKLKKTSPTAYCDCWEKCKCKALIAGNQTKRFDLLTRLVTDTDLVTKVNSRGESILLFLIQTVGRQTVEQRQYRANSRIRNSTSARKTPSLDADSDTPEHDLEPPRFARKALDRLLEDWASIRSMIMTGAEQEQAQIKANSMNQVFYDDSDNQSTYLHAQSGTTLLDKFTHSLFVRCSDDPLNNLVKTLVRELQNEAVSGRIEEAQKIARRFVRSVARVFVILNIERGHNADKQRTSSAQSRHIQAYRRVFSSLHKYAIEELVEIADALIAPVRMGVVRPTMPFSIPSNSIDSLSNADELFSVEPMAPSSNRENVPNIQTASINVVDDNADVQGSEFVARVRVRLRDDANEEANTQDDGEVSEQEDGDQLQNENRAEPDGQEMMRNEDGGAENESDNEFNFNEAESDSDSDDNQSTQDAQRSVQTGATAGSDTDDSNDSSQIDEGSDDNDSDDRSHEDLVFGEEQLERRSGNSGSQRNNLAPPSMQWAIRNRDTTRQSGVRLTNNSNVVFIDPTALRRSTNSNAAVAAASQEPATMATTSSALARAFAIVLRQISELLSTLPDVISNTGGSGHYLYMTYNEAVHLQIYVERRLRPTLEWILTVMDSTEAQLRFGGSLTDSADPSHPLHPLNNPPVQSTNNTTGSSSTTSGSSTLVIGSGQQRTRSTPTSTQSTDAHSSRRDFLTYCLSLMRAHNSEHRDSLPVLDITALRHIAYVLDALIFYMRSGNEISDIDKGESNPWDDQDENDNDDTEDEQTSSIAMDTDEEDNDLSRPSLGRRHPFFQRSESTLCLGCIPPDPFNTPFEEALPLADQPHLLTPNSRREELFAMPKLHPSSNVPPVATTSVAATNLDHSNNPLELPPVRLGLSRQIRIQEDLPEPELVPELIPMPTQMETDESSSINVKRELPDIIGDGTCRLTPPPPPPPLPPPHTSTTTTIQPVKNTTEDEVDKVKPPKSPLPGPSREPIETEVYFKKTRHFFQKEKAEKEAERRKEAAATQQQRVVTHQQYDEPQDLSHTANHQVAQLQTTQYAPQKNQNLSKSNANKMDIDDGMSDSSDVSSDYFHAKRKKNVNTEKDLKDRPPIIVTRKKVAAAIEYATATVLAKTNRNSLAECGSTKHAREGTTNANTSEFELPSEFFDLSDEESISSSSKKRKGSGGHRDATGSPSKTANNREGASNSNDTVQPVGTMETQEISANVTVETTFLTQQQVPQLELPVRGSYFRERSGRIITSDFLLRRWQVSLILFGRVFLEDVGMEPGSIISELGGFPVKETKFRRHMEKLRHAQQRDMTLSKMERNRASLITQTFKELNTLYGNNNRRIQPPLAYGRVKVTFKDEPGEGSGVARSFYTSIAEALLANEKLPNLESAQVGTSKYSVPFGSMLQRHRSSSQSTTPPRESLTSSSSLARRLYMSASSTPPNNSRTSGSTSVVGGVSGASSHSKPILWRTNRDLRTSLNVDARPYRPTETNSSTNSSSSASSSTSSSTSNLSAAYNISSNNPNDHLSLHQQQLGERLYPKVAMLYPKEAPKITGMLLELPSTQLLILVGSDETLRQRANEALELINAKQKGDNENPTDSNKKHSPIVLLEQFPQDDNAPLFYSPGKRGFYSPRQGFPTPERLNAFRNVGRLIGLCLLQNELLPLFLQRHVLKYILRRQIRFHDLAFFDPVVYESLRQLVKDSQAKIGNGGILSSLDLMFVIDLCPEEGGGTVELVPGGRDLPVSETNVYDYVRKYAEYRMIRTQEKALEAIRSGVFDVLPETALSTLTAEDLRLLLNGVGDIHVGTLISYTTFNDESNESSEKLLKFKRWLWSVVEKMTNLERQDLVYFWTGSPALPASEDGFQPMPSVTIRPADDVHLPTANTCISRLYIPLYSSRAILRHKLLLAIKTKNFGFV